MVTDGTKDKLLCESEHSYFTALSLCHRIHIFSNLMTTVAHEGRSISNKIWHNGPSPLSWQKDFKIPCPQRQNHTWTNAQRRLNARAPTNKRLSKRGLQRVARAKSRPGCTPVHRQQKQQKNHQSGRIVHISAQEGPRLQLQMSWQNQPPKRVFRPLVTLFHTCELHRASSFLACSLHAQ